MKKYYQQLDKLLQPYGFENVNHFKSGASIKWFEKRNHALDAVKTYLQFEYKRNFQTITVNIGWYHQQSHDFCINALRDDLPEVFSWLSQIGLLNWPCLLTHNLSDFLDFPLGGIDASGEMLNSSHINIFEDKVLNTTDWMVESANSLLNLYVKNDKPFTWRSSNTVLRIGVIAGLLKSLTGDSKIFDECSRAHIQLIQSDMFEMGDAVEWIKCLRAELS